MFYKENKVSKRRLNSFFLSQRQALKRLHKKRFYFWLKYEHLGITTSEQGLTHLKAEEFILKSGVTFQGEKKTKTHVFCTSQLLVLFQLRQESQNNLFPI